MPTSLNKRTVTSKKTHFQSPALTKEEGTFALFVICHDTWGKLRGEAYKMLSNETLE